MANLTFRIGVAYGEESKAEELAQSFEARDEWLQTNTTPMFFYFWLNNREFCQSYGIESYKSFLELYEKEPTINLFARYQRFQPKHGGGITAPSAVALLFSERAVFHDGRT